MATKLTDPASIDLLISEMTVAEKARLVIGGSPWCTEELPEYGIPKLFMLDSCNGLNLMEYESEFVYRDLEKQATAAGTPLDREKNGYMGGLLLALGALHKKAAEQKAAGVPEKEKPYGIYPPGIAYGSTWDPELVKKTSAVMAREMASYGIDRMFLQFKACMVLPCGLFVCKKAPHLLADFYARTFSIQARCLHSAARLYRSSRA